jgi:hypothetical protein
MFKRTVLAVLAAGALAVGVAAQEGATIVMRSGEKVSGQLVDMGGAGFTVRVSGQDRQIGKNDVAVIDFGGSGDISDADWNKVNGPGVLLRNGQGVSGQLSDIGGTSPLRISLSTSSGDRNFTSSEVSKIVLARPSSGVATSGTSNAPGVPEGQGVAVSGSQAWTPTGVTVRQGDRLTFSATGEVRLSADSADVASASGARSQRKSATAPLPSVFAGALIARVANSAPFPIGEQQTVTMPANGQLFLGINDDDVNDNQGGFRVVINRTRR